MAKVEAYKRTCSSCGYFWVLNRTQAGYQAGANKGFGFGASNLSMRRGRYGGSLRGRALQRRRGIDRNLVGAFGECAKCGSKHFTQEPMPGLQPPT